MSPQLAPLSALSVILRQQPTLLGDIRLLATDVDGTLTRAGKLAPEVVSAIARLAEVGVCVVPVSGRSAGEMLGLCRYLPGIGWAVAENGLVQLQPDFAPRLRVPAADRAGLKATAEAVARALGTAFELAPDDQFRVVDVAYERGARSEQALAEVAEAATSEGAYLVWSSVHFHLAPVAPDKGTAVLALAAELGIEPGAIVTIGDAPNDAGLFVEHRFGLTVGTADVGARRGYFSHLPQAMTAEREAEGFMELAQALLAARRP